ncbi:primase 1D-like protein [Pseudomonas monsensis]
MTLPSDDHPYWHVRDVLLRGAEQAVRVEMSYYKYVPQAVVDDRVIFSMPIFDFLNARSVEDRIRKCPSDCEMAIHSKLLTSCGAFLHLPMIDMSTGSAAQLEKLKPILGKDFSGFVWFKSGRSYHGYGSKMIEHDHWVGLMGKLLLANQVGVPHTVDPRWVGHRLIAGYAALRWTKNTNHYVDMPKKLKSPYSGLP